MVVPVKPLAIPLALPQQRHLATRKAAQVLVSRQGQEVMASALPEAAFGFSATGFGGDV